MDDPAILDIKNPTHRLELWKIWFLQEWWNNRPAFGLDRGPPIVWKESLLTLWTLLRFLLHPLCVFLAASSVKSLRSKALSKIALPVLSKNLPASHEIFLRMFNVPIDCVICYDESRVFCHK